MKIFTSKHNIQTKGFTDIIDITNIVQDELTKCCLEKTIEDGFVNLFVLGSTAGITTIEYEPGLVGNDFSAMLEKIAPYKNTYAHNSTWGDNNGASHLRSSLIGVSFSVPFTDKKLLLGTWQQIALIDFDTTKRSRQLVVQIIGS